MGKTSNIDSTRQALPYPPSSTKERFWTLASSSCTDYTTCNKKHMYTLVSTRKFCHAEKCDRKITPSTAQTPPSCEGGKVLPCDSKPNTPLVSCADRAA